MLFGIAFVQLLPSTKSPSTDAALASEGPSTSSAPGRAATTPNDLNGAAQPVTTSKWSYSQDADQMRGTITKYAVLQSSNELSFGFPYHGGNATLHLRHSPKDGMRVLLSVDGQFLCNSFSNTTVSVKFDSGPIRKFGCTDTAEGTTGVVFINSEKRFVDLLKKAQFVTIEADFFQSGPQQMTFNVAGLNWM